MNVPHSIHPPLSPGLIFYFREELPPKLRWKLYVVIVCSPAQRLQHKLMSRQPEGKISFTGEWEQKDTRIIIYSIDREASPISSMAQLAWQFLQQY